MEGHLIVQTLSRLVQNQRRPEQVWAVPASSKSAIEPSSRRCCENETARYSSKQVSRPEWPERRGLVPAYVFPYCIEMVGKLEHGGDVVLKPDLAEFRLLADLVRRVNAPSTVKPFVVDKNAPAFFDGVVMLDDRRRVPVACSWRSHFQEMVRRRCNQKLVLHS